MKLAAIDIGSNAIKLLFCNVYENKKGLLIKKSSFIRVPLRLGEDVFSTGKISDDKAEKLLQSMKAFNDLMKVHKVVKFKACATSAMREAANGNELVEKIKNESGIAIEIINGEQEADIIFSRHLEENLDNKKSYLYIDVGGGSTEVAIFSKTERISSHSFNIGTIRMLQERVSEVEWAFLKMWIKENSHGIKDLEAIGSGGNINTLNKLVNRKDIKAIPYVRLKELDEYLNSFTYNERIEILGLNTDRADVIIHASKIFLTIMNVANIKKIHVPKIGLSDGIIRKVYEEHMKNSL